MSIKQIELSDIGSVTLQKRRGSRNVRLSLSHDGLVRVTLPFWVPYQTGLNFVKSKTNWIIANQQKLKPEYRNGQAIGKNHFLYFKSSEEKSRIHTQLKDNLAIVSIPTGMSNYEKAIQQAARSVSIRALRQEAEGLLPARLQELAHKHSYIYKSVSIRSLKSRWGSCNQNGDITLNLFLMQLPWELIDYILLHELTHTKVMHHGKPFWAEMSLHTRDLASLRKAVLSYRPVL